MKILAVPIVFSLMCISNVAIATDSSQIVRIESNQEKTTGSIFVSYVLNSRQAAFLEIWAHRKLGQGEVEGIRLGVVPVNYGGATIEFPVAWWKSGVSYHPSWARISSKIVYESLLDGGGSQVIVTDSEATMKSRLEKQGFDTRYIEPSPILIDPDSSKTQSGQQKPSNPPVWSGW